MFVVSLCNKYHKDFLTVKLTTITVTMNYVTYISDKCIPASPLHGSCHRVGWSHTPSIQGSKLQLYTKLVTFWYTVTF